MEVILLVGIAASGKTTFCKQFFSNHFRISLDEIEKHSRTKQAQIFENNLKLGKNIIIDDTNLTRKIRSMHIKLAKKYDAELKAIFFNYSMDRIELQNSKREKSLPNYVLFSMKKQLEVPSEEEGFDFIQILT